MEDTTAARALAALAHPHRLAILRRLATAGEPGVQGHEMAGPPPAPNRQAVSEHLQVLARAGLVEAGRAGRGKPYTIVPAAAASLLAALTQALGQSAPVPQFAQPKAPPPPAPVLAPAALELLDEPVDVAASDPQPPAPSPVKSTERAAPKVTKRQKTPARPVGAAEGEFVIGADEMDSQAFAHAAGYPAGTGREAVNRAFHQGHLAGRTVRFGGKDRIIITNANVQATRVRADGRFSSASTRGLKIGSRSGRKA